MPTLGQVVDTFTQEFTYLNKDTNKRNNRWFEFFLRPDESLTKAIEGIALALKANLILLKTNSGNNDFAQGKASFGDTIAKALKQVQEQRVVHGEIETTYAQDEETLLSYATHSLCPKKPAYFEETLINGLDAVREAFPDLWQLVDEMVTKINTSTVKPIRVSQEKFSGALPQKGESLEWHFTKMQDNYHDSSSREEYAKEYIKELTF